MGKDFLLLIHPTFGMLAAFAAIWVFVETLNASSANEGRIIGGAKLTAALMWLTYIFGGYWYVVYYNAEKAVIKGGPWPWAHGFFMESKEHLFMMLLILATLLPIVAARGIAGSKAAQQVTLWTSGLVVLMALAMEGAGAFINMGVKVALLGKA